MNHSWFCSDGTGTPLWEALAHLWAPVCGMSQQVVVEAFLTFVPMVWCSEGQPACISGRQAGRLALVSVPLGCRVASGVALNSTCGCSYLSRADLPRWPVLGSEKWRLGRSKRGRTNVNTNNALAAVLWASHQWYLPMSCRTAHDRPWLPFSSWGDEDSRSRS